MKRRNFLSFVLFLIPFFFLTDIAPNYSKVVTLIGIVGLAVVISNRYLLNPERLRKKALIFGTINETIWISVSGMIINLVNGFNWKFFAFLFLSWFVAGKLLSSVQQDVNMNEKYIIFCDTIKELDKLLDEAEKMKFDYIFSHANKANMQDLVVEFKGEEIKALLLVETDELIQLINEFDVVALENLL